MLVCKSFKKEKTHSALDLFYTTAVAWTLFEGFLITKKFTSCISFELLKTATRRALSFSNLLNVSNCLKSVRILKTVGRSDTQMCYNQLKILLQSVRLAFGSHSDHSSFEPFEPFGWLVSALDEFVKRKARPLSQFSEKPEMISNHLTDQTQKFDLKSWPFWMALIETF